MSYFQTLIDFADKFSDLAGDHSKWSDATFGTPEHRGPIGPLRHLEKEAAEAVDAVMRGDAEEIRMELADCFLLILDAARRQRIKPMELVIAAQEKLKILKTRNYSPSFDQWEFSEPQLREVPGKQYIQRFWEVVATHKAYKLVAHGKGASPEEALTKCKEAIAYYRNTLPVEHKRDDDEPAKQTNEP
jgi:NTP pyrophosphatase (non-canonical NTP hydrolase)